MNFFLVAWHTLDTLITPHQLFHINNIFLCVLNEMKGSWYDTAMFGSEKKKNPHFLLHVITIILATLSGAW